MGAGAVEGNVATATALKGVLEEKVLVVLLVMFIYLWLTRPIKNLESSSAGILHHVAGVGTVLRVMVGRQGMRILDFPDFGVIDKNGNLIFRIEIIHHFV